MILCYLGVHTVANIDDNIECSYILCLIGACIPLPILLVSSKLDTFITYSALSSVVVANMYGTQQARHRPRTSHPCTVTFVLQSF